MSQVNDDIQSVRDALDILSGKRRNNAPLREVAHNAIAAWERVDKVLYDHIGKATLGQIKTGK